MPLESKTYCVFSPPGSVSINPEDISTDSVRIIRGYVRELTFGKRNC
jgi:hypothetical protein